MPMDEEHRRSLERIRLRFQSSEPSIKNNPPGTNYLPWDNFLRCKFCTAEDPNTSFRPTASDLNGTCSPSFSNEGKEGPTAGWGKGQDELRNIQNSSRKKKKEKEEEINYQFSWY